MSMKPVQRAIAELMRKKLAWGIAVMALTQILGGLAALDFLPVLYLKLASFGLGVILTIAKGVEMFFDQSAQLESTVEESHVTRDATGTVETGSSKTTTTTPVPPQTS